MKHNYLNNTPLTDAQDIYFAHLLKSGFTFDTEKIPSAKATGRILYQVVYALICSPHYNASAMDGIAVKSSDTYGASENNPIILAQNQYAVVDTGDPIPKTWWNIVLNVLNEYVFSYSFIGDIMITATSKGDNYITELSDGKVSLLSATHPWQNVRQVGEDICMGDMIAPSFTKITPSLCGAFLAGGVTEVEVIKKPKVGIIPTGDEIVSPTSNPQKGEIIEFNKIPLDDQETLKIFETANTSGVFQFESTGMRNFLRRLKPNTFEDIFAAIALFRPGAAVNIDTYIKRRHKEEKVEYIDKALEPISKNTYGLLIYQEQIMQLASLYADYSLGEADILRRAMSKKKLDLLKSEEEKFITKSIKKGHSKEDAKKIYELVLNFAGFGFNRSHSVAYSIIAYKMAYLKTHYKTIFFANLLTNVIGSEAKTHEYIMEAKANKIEVEKPTINKSDSRYIVENNKIIYPISNIKSIGTVISDTIKRAKAKGPFTDIYDTFSRLYIEGVGKKNFETLIMADVFKEFEYNRATLIYNLDSLFNYAELTKDIDPSLVMKPDIEYQKEYESAYLLEKEKEVFGFYLSSHPTTMYKKDNPYCIPLNSVDKNFGKQIDTLILVDKIKTISTKKGDKMAFITGSDETATLEYTLFPKTYNMYFPIERGELLKIRGNVERRLDQIQIIVEKIKKLNEKEEENEE